MRMGTLEKQFVNNAHHSQRVVREAERLMNWGNPQFDQDYLDVGTGNGAVPIYLSKKYGLQATGIDVDPHQIALAENNSVGESHLRFLTLDGSCLPFSDHEFDVVSTFKNTHHIPKWESALSEIIRVIKLGGYLVYLDFLLPDWLVPIGKKLVRGKMGFPTRNNIKRLVQNHNLTIIHQSNTGFLFEGVYQKQSYKNDIIH